MQLRPTLELLLKEQQSTLKAYEEMQKQLQFNWRLRPESRQLTGKEAGRYNLKLGEKIERVKRNIIALQECLNYADTVD